MSQIKSQKPVEDRGEESLQHLRERCEPVTTNTKIPAWIFVLCSLLAAGAFIYLGKYTPSLRYDEFLSASDKIPTPPPGSGAEAVELTALEELMKTGKTKYELVCQSCHQPNGSGGSGFPPLVNSEWVSGPTQRLGLIILHGLKGPITVNGQAYNGNMAPQGNNFSDPEDLAAVMSYVRVTFGMPDMLDPERTLVSTEVAQNILAIAYDGQTTAADLTANHLVYTPGAILDPETGEPLP